MLASLIAILAMNRISTIHPAITENVLMKCTPISQYGVLILAMLNSLQHLRSASAINSVALKPLHVYHKLPPTYVVAKKCMGGTK